MKGLKAKIEKHPERNTPRRFYDIESNASNEKPEKIAEEILGSIAPKLKINPDLSQLKFDKTKESILGHHVLYQQYFEGVPISGAWIRVDIDPEGKVYNINNDLVPETVLKRAEKLNSKKAGGDASPNMPQLDVEEAKKRALEISGAKANDLSEILESELVYYPKEGVPTLAWKIIVKSQKPVGEWKIYLDAITGGIIDKINMLRTLEGQGKVFDPNPVVTLKDTSLEDNAQIPDAAYRLVPLRDLSNSGMLDGPYVTTKLTPNRVKRSDAKFIFRREERAFKEVMVYFHIDRVQRYIQQLGFTNILNRPIEVNIDGIREDNSFYSPSTKSLTFGTGGVDDAEDAEIILHEYGHAILDDQVPGFGPRGEARAMGEGFGDYLAASFFSDNKPDVLKPTVGNWDAVAYSGAEPPCLRRLDSNKKYPKDIVGEEHDDGEIWSACLWELRKALGGRTSDQLVIAHHFLLTPTTKFEEAANALITADKRLNDGRNENTIRDIFIRRGILPNPRRKNKRAGVPFEDISLNGKGI
ncbi:peptidase M36 [Rhodocytophaga rosea]|uniref:Peptidase M36 n=1 Tax=Rhodocytophaga rosea TaxID=2704465 RepID=A0A6C0GBY6_9BACT|nr:M36 family metallopeptidase [Rhodocytophaga rosea]QHT65332.1 peptidase M36 [Rhodocytophaga rosea]